MDETAFFAAAKNGVKNGILCEHSDIRCSARMLTLVYVLFTIVCVFLIITVLLQPGKAGGLGAAFGGGGNTVFGASGGTSVFRKITTGCAVCFMLLSLLLAYLSLDTSVTSQNTTKRRGLDFSNADVGLEMPTPTAAEVAPAAAPVAPAAAEVAPVAAPVAPTAAEVAPVAAPVAP